jgi:hypothetical protein
MPTATQNTFDRDKLANWYAKRHLDIDKGVVKILYLPKGAPAREIRFLEVNRLITESTHPEPIDFGVDIGGPDAHTLFVLDVTPAQIKSIEQGKAPRLPAGWTLEGAKEYVRGRRS